MTIEPKNKRRCRSERLAYSLTSDPTPIFEPTIEKWKQIEKSYGFQIETDDRQIIIGLVTRYFLFEPFERSGALVKDAEDWLAKVRAAGEKFYELVFPDEQFSEAAKHAWLRIDDSLEKWPHLHVRNMDDVFNTICCFLEAAADVAKDLEEGRDNRPNLRPQWDILVSGLLEWAQSRGLPSGASKGAGGSGRVSPFVAFVRELQLMFPGEYRQHNTNDALSKEINRIRRDMREARDLNSKQANDESPV
jgi:hypothetical protein